MIGITSAKSAKRSIFLQSESASLWSRFPHETLKFFARENYPRVGNFCVRICRGDQPYWTTFIEIQTYWSIAVCWWTARTKTRLTASFSRTTWVSWRHRD